MSGSNGCAQSKHALLAHVAWLWLWIEKPCHRAGCAVFTGRAPSCVALPTHPCSATLPTCCIHCRTARRLSVVRSNLPPCFTILCLQAFAPHFIVCLLLLLSFLSTPLTLVRPRGHCSHTDWCTAYSLVPVYKSQKMAGVQDTGGGVRRGAMGGDQRRASVRNVRRGAGEWRHTGGKLRNQMRGGQECMQTCRKPG